MSHSGIIEYIVQVVIDIEIFNINRENCIKK